MKIFFYTGRNTQNVSGVSWKIWKIERKGRQVQTWWGSVNVDKRQIVPTATLQTQRRTHRTEDSAKANESRRIREKINSGYEKKP